MTRVIKPRAPLRGNDQRPLAQRSTKGTRPEDPRSFGLEIAALCVRSRVVKGGGP